MTKPITKAECEEVIEKLADKTLSFGCRIKDYPSEMIMRYCGKLSNGEDSFSYQFLGDGEELYRQKNDNYEGRILGHPVMIGDVLEKLRSRIYFSFENFGDGDTIERELSDLLQAWEACGFDKSLQQICDDAVWDDTDPDAEVKYKPAADLFTFLKSIL